MNLVDLIVSEFYETRFKNLRKLWAISKSFSDEYGVLRENSDIDAFCMALEKILMSGRLRIFTIGLFDESLGLHHAGMLGGSFKDQADWFRKNIPPQLPENHPDYDEEKDANNLWWLCNTTFGTVWLQAEANGDITWVDFDF